MLQQIRVVRRQAGAYHARMPIFLDDYAVDLEGDSLGAVLASAKRQLEPHGRVVVEVRLNDRLLTADQIAQAHGTAVEGQEVKLYSADPRQLARATLEAVREHLAQARQYQEDAADLLQQDEARQAMGKIGQAVEVWLQAQQAVAHSAAMVGIELGRLGANGRPFEELTQDLIQKLQTLKVLITSQDTVALADTLAYEWPQAIEQWDALIADLIERIEAG